MPKDPTYAELLATVRRIAGLVFDGDEIAGEAVELGIDDAYDTLAACRTLARDCLGTDGSDLPHETGAAALHAIERQGP